MPFSYLLATSIMWMTVYVSTDIRDLHVVKESVSPASFAIFTISRPSIDKRSSLLPPRGWEVCNFTWYPSFRAVAVFPSLRSSLAEDSISGSSSPSLRSDNTVLERTELSSCWLSNNNSQWCCKETLRLSLNTLDLARRLCSVSCLIQHLSSAETTSRRARWS